ncbi:MAG: tRNA lysidine(34) synthetase TilS [Alphaproteobacteria bacterium]|nr:tRNA lysidine(34) synthetase TilS [Alphaproteobacteria bacterium]
MSSKDSVNSREFLFDALNPYESIIKQEPIAVAVSGGSDSLALVYALLKYYPAHRHHIWPVTFDHQLRKESECEAQGVASLMQARGLRHTTLIWQGPKPQADLMNKAREKRYNALTLWMEQNRLRHLFLGHHLDDHLETVFMRFLKKSGSDGLKGMTPLARNGEIICVRPFLALKKQQLQTFLSREQHTWFEDPTNHNVKYARSLARLLLGKERLQEFMSAHASLLSEFSILSSRLKHSFINAFMVVQPAGYVRCDKDIWDQMPLSFRVDILRTVIQRFRGLIYAPKRKKVEMLLSKVDRGITLGGCFIWTKPGTLYIARELDSATKIDCSNEACRLIEWDQRFKITVKETDPETYLRPLGHDGWRLYLQKSKRKLDLEIPFPVILTLPSLWNGGMLLEVPHLSDVLPSLKSEGKKIQEVCVLNRLIASIGTSLEDALNLA